MLLLFADRAVAVPKGEGMPISLIFPARINRLRVSMVSPAMGRESGLHAISHKVNRLGLRQVHLFRRWLDGIVNAQSVTWNRLTALGVCLETKKF